MIDARAYFDRYIVKHASWQEIVEVLRYTDLFSERCIGRILAEVKKQKLEKENESDCVKDGALCGTTQV